MKKFFFFRSHSDDYANNDELSVPPKDKQVDSERPIEREKKSRKDKHSSDDQVFGRTPCLRRSFSFSSVIPYREALRTIDDQTGSPCSTNHYANKHSRQNSFCSHPVTPERKPQRGIVDAATIRNAHRVENFDRAVPRAYSDTSEILSSHSSNVSNNVLDRYVVSEQHMEKCESKPKIYSNIELENGNAVVKWPPRFQFSALASLDARNQKPKSQSFRASKTSHFHLSSKDGSCSEYCPGSPQKLAKHVAERLSQPQLLPKMKLKELHPDYPNVYGRTMNRPPNAFSVGVSPKYYTTDWKSETAEGTHEEILEHLEDPASYNYKNGGDIVSSANEVDLELYKRFEEAEGRASILAEQLGKEDFLQFNELSVPLLIQIIRCLTEEKLNMALEISAILEDWIHERALFREKCKHGNTELDAQAWRLEKEKNEFQVALEKELDKRSMDGFLRFEKYQAEEHRLRERIQELAEWNVNLQKEICSFDEREKDAISKTTDLEMQLGDMSFRVKEKMKENHHLLKTLSELNEKARAAKGERDCLWRNYEEKVTECKDMYQIISRLQRTCNDQEKTIAGLRELCEELGKKNHQEHSELGLENLHAEHMRLTGVEHVLQKEVESYRVQVNTLRKENIDLLNRLKNHGNEGYSTFKLDQELQSRVSCLQNQMLPLLVESTQLGKRLLEYVKSNGIFPPKNGSTSSTYLDVQVVVECEVRIQGLEQAAENLPFSMQTMANILKEKSALLIGKFHSTDMDASIHSKADGLLVRNEQKSENFIRSELKAETLLTNLLQEKLYSKEKELEHLQAEVAAAVRSNDIIRCELQNALDDFSSINHKMKELELQMMKKNETINQLEGELQDCKKELGIVRGILSKVSEERDMMWEKVKQYSESNMLLSREMDVLKKKLEDLEEDILLKEGQISILRDSINQPLDLLA